MNKKVLGVLFSLALSLVVGARASAETSLTVLPAANDVSLVPGTHLEYSIKVKNESSEKIECKIYATPYSVLTDDNDIDVLNETKWSHIAKWITFIDDNGEEQPTLTVSLEGNSDKTIRYLVTAPENNLPAGGQYAMIFAETTSSKSLRNGINAASRVGAMVYGETNIDAVRSGDILDMSLSNFMVSGNISGNLKVKNTGNTNLMVTQELEVESLYDKVQTILNENTAVFPERTKTIKQEWKDTPSFGIFKVTYNIYILGEKTSISGYVFIVPIWMMIIIIAGILSLFGLIYIAIQKLIKKLKH